MPTVLGYGHIAREILAERERSRDDTDASNSLDPSVMTKEKKKGAFEKERMRRKAAKSIIPVYVRFNVFDVLRIHIGDHMLHFRGYVELCWPLSAVKSDSGSAWPRESPPEKPD